MTRSFHKQKRITLIKNSEVVVTVLEENFDLFILVKIKDCVSVLYTTNEMFIS